MNSSSRLVPALSQADVRGPLFVNGSKRCLLCVPTRVEAPQSPLGRRTAGRRPLPRWATAWHRPARAPANACWIARRRHTIGSRLWRGCPFRWTPRRIGCLPCRPGTMPRGTGGYPVSRSRPWPGSAWNVPAFRCGVLRPCLPRRPAGSAWCCGGKACMATTRCGTAPRAVAKRWLSRILARRLPRPWRRQWRPCHLPLRRIHFRPCRRSPSRRPRLPLRRRRALWCPRSISIRRPRWRPALQRKRLAWRRRYRSRSRQHPRRWRKRAQLSPPCRSARPPGSLRARSRHIGPRLPRHRRRIVWRTQRRDPPRGGVRRTPGRAPRRCGPYRAVPLRHGWFWRRSIESRPRPSRAARPVWRRPITRCPAGSRTIIRSMRHR